MKLSSGNAGVFATNAAGVSIHYSHHCCLSNDLSCHNSCKPSPADHLERALIMIKMTGSKCERVTSGSKTDRQYLDFHDGAEFDFQPVLETSQQHSKAVRLADQPRCARAALSRKEVLTSDM